MHYRNQHGAYTYRWSGDILLVTIDGVWNEVCSTNLHGDVLKLVQQGRPERWALFNDCKQWEGAVPEATTLWFDLFFKMCVEQGMVCCASIMPSHFIARVVKDFTVQCSELVPTHNFLTTVDALSWLKERGFRVSEPH